MKIILLSVFLCIGFSACSGKQMKKYGGELVLNGGGGHPIGAAIGATVGGTIYGIGALIEKDEKNNKQESINEDEPQTYEKEDLEVKF